MSAQDPAAAAVIAPQASPLLRLPLELRDKIYGLTFADEQVTDWNFKKEPQAELHLRRTCRQIYTETQNWIKYVTFNFHEVEHIRTIHANLSLPRFKQIKQLELQTSLMERKNGVGSCTWSALIALNTLQGLDLNMLRITPEWRLRGKDDFLGVVDMIQKGCGWRQLVVTLSYWAMLLYNCDTGRLRKPQDELTYDNSPIPSYLHRLLQERDGEDSGAAVIVRRALEDIPRHRPYDDFPRLCQAATYKQDSVGLEYHNRDLPVKDRYEQRTPSWEAFRHLEIIVKRGHKAQVLLQNDDSGTNQFRPKWEEWKKVNPWGAGR